MQQFDETVKIEEENAGVYVLAVFTLQMKSYEEIGKI